MYESGTRRLFSYAAAQHSLFSLRKLGHTPYDKLINTGPCAKRNAERFVHTSERAGARVYAFRAASSNAASTSLRGKSAHVL